MPAGLNHTVHGEPRGTALLLVHPLGADLRFWDEFAVIWPQPIALIACDLRGSGQSPRARAPVPLDQHVDDIEALRRDIGVDTLIPVGCAIGAMPVACYAAAHPTRVAALVLSNPALKTSLQARAMLAQRAERVRAGGMDAILPDAVDRAFLDQPRDARYDRYYRMFARQDAEAYALSALAALDADITGELGRVRCPTLVVAGRHDALLPPETSRDVHALLQDAAIAVVEEAAHFVPYQRAQEFADLIAAFLRGRGMLPG
jgi:3-oxoadipate enol-lactonase